MATWRIVNGLSRLARTAWGTVLGTVLVVFTGGLWSLYSAEIRSAWPFSGGPYGGISWLACWSWTAIVVTALYLWLNTRGLTREAAAIRRRLHRLIRSMPPEYFMRLVGDLFVSVDADIQDVLNVDDETRQREFEVTMRDALLSVALLAKAFDGNAPDRIYAANIMQFIPTSSMLPEVKARINEKMLFRAEGATVDGYLGVLAIVNAYSASTGEAPGKSDPALPTLIVPVPVPEEHMTPEGRYNILPGAPFAFCTKQHSVFRNIDELSKWMEEYGDFQEARRRKVVDYFKATPSVRSFISIPLLSSAAELVDAEEPEVAPPVGVLNIHCDEPRLLRGGHGAELFASSIRPFEARIAELVRIAVREGHAVLAVR